MDNFKVDGILCEVRAPLCLSPGYCYDGSVITEEDETYQVLAKYKGRICSCLFDKGDTEEDIINIFAVGLRAFTKRLDRKIA